MTAEGLDVLAVGPHPDDVELGCGGTLARLAASRRRVGILHLTSGEAGTRGSAERRRREAERAAEVLGASELAFLDCGDGGLRHGRDEEDALIGRLRQWRPALVLGPAPTDRHPDHGRAYRLVRDACFYAGLARRSPELGPDPYRPGLFLSYMQHDPFVPSLIVDVTGTWETKLQALDAYASQLHRAGEDAQPEAEKTLTSSPEFAAAIEGRARHFGLQIGTAFGEPFWSPLPLSVPDLMTIVPAGLR